MSTSWTPANAAADVLKLTGSTLTCTFPGSITACLTIQKVYEGEHKFALERVRETINAMANSSSIMRCYGLECSLTRLDGAVIKVVIVAAEFNNGYYAELKLPQLSTLTPVEAQMTDFIRKVAKSRVSEKTEDPAVPEINSFESASANLLGINLSANAFDDVELDPL